MEPYIAGPILHRHCGEMRMTPFRRWFKAWLIGPVSPSAIAELEIGQNRLTGNRRLPF